MSHFNLHLLKVGHSVPVRRRPGVFQCSIHAKLSSISMPPATQFSVSIEPFRLSRQNAGSVVKIITNTQFNDSRVKCISRQVSVGMVVWFININFVVKHASCHYPSLRIFGWMKTSRFISSLVQRHEANTISIRGRRKKTIIQFRIHNLGLLLF